MITDRKGLENCLPRWGKGWLKLKYIKAEEARGSSRGWARAPGEGFPEGGR